MCALLSTKAEKNKNKDAIGEVFLAHMLKIAFMKIFQSIQVLLK